MYLKKVLQKNKDGTDRVYLQFVESVRKDGKPRQNILVNLGRIDDKSGKEKMELLATALVQLAETIDILDLQKDVEGLWSKELGPHLIFSKLFEKINLKSILSQGLNTQVKSEFDSADAIYNLILNRLTEPRSKNATIDWQTNQYGINQYDKQHYYRAMDHLEEHREEIEQSLFDHMKSLSSEKKKSYNIALFDTTTLVYFGKGQEEESLLDFGFSKAHRSDLKQVVVGLALTGDGVPLSHQVYSGNTNDVSCFTDLINKFVEKHQQNAVTFVGDRGMISHKNIQLLHDSGYNYVLGFRMRTIKKEERAEILNKVNLKEIKENLEYKDVTYKNLRLVVCYNKERAEKDAKKRQEILERIKNKIAGGKITAIIDNTEYKKYLKIEGESPKLDQEKISQDQLFDGIFILTTNTKMRAGEVVSTYRSLWMCEAGFRALKSDLEMGPIYHYKDRRIRSHIFICFLALILRVMLTKYLKQINQDASYKKVIGELKRLSAIKVKIKKSTIILRTEITENAKLAFKALGSSFPKKVLHHENNNSLVIIYK